MRLSVMALAMGAAVLAGGHVSPARAGTDALSGYASAQDIPEDFSAPADEKPWLHRKAKQNENEASGPFLLQEKALKEQITRLKQQNEASLQQQQVLQVQLNTAKSRNTELEGRNAELSASLDTELKNAQVLKESQARQSQAQAELETLQKQMAQTETALHEAQSRVPADVALKTPEQQRAYASGVALAQTLAETFRMQHSLGVAPMPEQVMAGARDALAKKVRLNAEVMTARLKDFDADLNHRLAEHREKEAQERAQQEESGRKFVAEYKKKKGVRNTEGILWRELRGGKGSNLKPGEDVIVLLTGKTAKGDVFDDSGEKKQQQKVRPEALLPALGKILTQVNPGSEVEVVLSPEQGFGDEGVSGLIPGGATLIFNIQVVRRV